MGYKLVSIKLPTNYSEEELRKKITKMFRIRSFSFQIENKSLDARNKKNIFWQIRIAVFSDELKDDTLPAKESLIIPFQKRKKKVVVVGSGPAGFFCALVLQQAGFHTTLIERGSDVIKRGKAIANFEAKGLFDPKNNYAFGEGGAGTFSDGKLTSRSKHISKEKQYILSSYVRAGAPKEIKYLAHPHLGTDNLKVIVKNLRDEFEGLGGTLLFETQFEDIKAINGKVSQAITDKGIFDIDSLFIAPGHSAYETYRMLMSRGVLFRTKKFAIGSRMEHRQEIINQAQWGTKSLPGVKAAEYRLTSPGDGKHQVFSFCMCPGGIVVPASAYSNSNIVNGMSYYNRDGEFANAACVAGIHPDDLAGKEVSPFEALAQLETLEGSFYSFSNNYSAPACGINDFLNGKLTETSIASSYPLGIKKAPVWEMLPLKVTNAMREGLKDFNQKMKGFEQGHLLGLESKTSSPIQVIREKDGLCANFQNLYMVGEGSGYAGGIISSAADGIKAAINFVEDN